MPLVFAEPPISLSTANALAVFFAGSYVGSLYLSKNARLSFKRGSIKPKQGQQRTKEQDERWRDDPDVIRARLAAASLSTLSSCVAVLGLVWKLLGWAPTAFPVAFETTLARLGFDVPASLSELVFPCLVTPVLFLGPLYGYWLSGALPLQRNWSWKLSVIPLLTTWQSVRNYMVGPTTEEIVFRSCSLAVYHLAGASRVKMIFMTPWLFGIAHIHHAWDIYNRYGRTGAAVKHAAIATLFQSSYTSLFGFHTAFLFLRTGSLIPPITAHIFCNIMGLPQLGTQLTMFPHRRRAIKVAYLLGIAGYIYAMNRWTLAPESLYWRPADAIAMF
ncbi:uncharacterized protein C8Q71DRAFT_907882 [Rhodofomes roseus]|uniref:intramembrane prenyl-peptidase Rce1 n=1 Tax=Rhodofomes roseus TaxID=34475 RepID=A0ABQ8KEW5_9APHY|nr:uncharacterized protein C8Q71DRAFT_907882 [Rhodofomes roseus]KAH9836274.1 hypothetical protein C8Q71DRAFT_907882 [Rhodofomes roseus]